MADKNYLSKERYKELEKELEELKTKGRKKVADRLKKAKALGDLSENSEYQEARNERDQLEQKINKLQNILRNAEIIKKSKNSDKVRVGSKVKIKKGKKKSEYTIVGSQESDPAEGLISNESPIGQALLGARVGEEVEVKTPKGNKTYEVVKIS